MAETKELERSEIDRKAAEQKVAQLEADAEAEQDRKISSLFAWRNKITTAAFVLVLGNVGVTITCATLIENRVTIIEERMHVHGKSQPSKPAAECGSFARLLGRCD